MPNLRDSIKKFCEFARDNPKKIVMVATGMVATGMVATGMVARGMVARGIVATGIVAPSIAVTGIAVTGIAVIVVIVVKKKLTTNVKPELKNQLSDFVIKTQALDNISEDLMYMGNKKINNITHSSIMSDISSIIINGTQTGSYNCINATCYQDYFCIQAESTKTDTAGREAPIIIYFNKKIVADNNIEKDSDFIKNINEICGFHNRNLTPCAEESLKSFFEDSLKK